ncbi:MAG: hypothetical protein AAFO89_00880 [Planctomycetota bacterium]
METLFGFDDLAPRDSGGLNGDIPSPTPISRDRKSVIGQIIELNPTATANFLNQFNDEQLWLYLSHLVASQAPRGREAVWQRPGDSPAVLAAQSAA